MDRFRVLRFRGFWVFTWFSRFLGRGAIHQRWIHPRCSGGCRRPTPLPDVDRRGWGGRWHKRLIRWTGRVIVRLGLV